MTDEERTLPDPPDASVLPALGINDDELHTVQPDEMWWRLHRTQGEHVLAWNTFRSFGPILRFDPQRLPRGEDSTRSVWYGASTPTAAIGEVFQVRRVIDLHRGGPYLTGLRFARPLQVLDVAADSVGAWATRSGGDFAISTGPRSITQKWAQAVLTAFPDLDGIRYNSRFAGDPCLALFAPARTAMPARPMISLPLDHPALALRIAGAANALGYLIS